MGNKNVVSIDSLHFTRKRLKSCVAIWIGKNELADDGFNV